MCFPLDNHPNHSTLSPMPTDRPEPVSMTVLNYVSLLHSFSFSDNLVPSRSVPMLSVPIGREVSLNVLPNQARLWNLTSIVIRHRTVFWIHSNKDTEDRSVHTQVDLGPCCFFCFFFSEPDSLRTHGFWTPIQFGEQYNFTYIEPWCTAPTNCAQVGGKKKKTLWRAKSLVPCEDLARTASHLFRTKLGPNNSEKFYLDQTKEIF